VLENRKKIILAKVGLDGHDNGIRIISKWLMDEGYDIVYAGLYNTPKKVIEMAIEEGVDGIGLSFLGGEHLFYAKTFVSLLKKCNLENIKLIIGGVIPPLDVETMKNIGVHEVFTPGTRKQEILERIKALFS